MITQPEILRLSCQCLMTHYLITKQFITEVTTFLHQENVPVTTGGKGGKSIMKQYKAYFNPDLGWHNCIWKQLRIDGSKTIHRLFKCKAFLIYT